MSKLTAGVGQQSVIETPRGTKVFPERNTQTSTARRNLLSAFEDAESEQTIPMEIEVSDFPQPVDTSTTLGSEPSAEEENKMQWSGFVFIWSVIFAIGGIIIGGIPLGTFSILCLCYINTFRNSC